MTSLAAEGACSDLRALATLAWLEPEGACSNDASVDGVGVALPLAMRAAARAQEEARLTVIHSESKIGVFWRAHEDRVAARQLLLPVCNAAVKLSRAISAISASADGLQDVMSSHRQSAVGQHVLAQEVRALELGCAELERSGMRADAPMTAAGEEMDSLHEAFSRFNVALRDRDAELCKLRSHACACDAQLAARRDVHKAHGSAVTSSMDNAHVAAVTEAVDDAHAAAVEAVTEAAHARFEARCAKEAAAHALAELQLWPLNSAALTTQEQGAITLAPGAPLSMGADADAQARGASSDEMRRGLERERDATADVNKKEVAWAEERRAWAAERRAWAAERQAAQRREHALRDELEVMRLRHACMQAEVSAAHALKLAEIQMVASSVQPTGPARWGIDRGGEQEIRER